MTNEEHRLETPEAFDARVHAELSAVEVRIRDEAMGEDDARELRTLYSEKHAAEKEFNTPPMSLDEFLEFKAVMNFTPVRTEVPAIPDAPEHAPRVTEAPEVILDVAATLSPSDEAPVAAPENDNWKIIVDHINNVNRQNQQRKPALRYLNKDGVADFARADAIEAELATMEDERILTRDEIEKKRALEAEYSKIVDDETRAKKDAETADRTIDGTLDLVFREFERLPEELQGAIRTTDEAVLRKYGVNIWASQEIRGEIFRRERAEEEQLRRQRKDEEYKAKNKPARMTLKSLVRSLDNSDFANYSKKDIEAIFTAEGIPTDDIGLQLQLLKEKELARLIARGIDAGVDAEIKEGATIPTFSSAVEDSRKSKLPVPPADGMGVPAPEVAAVITPEAAQESAFTPPPPEKLAELVSALNDAKKGIDETYETERKNKDGKEGEEVARKARRNRDRLNTLAQRTALEIAGRDALFGAVKLPDLAAIETYQKAVPKGLKGVEKRKAEATLSKDALDAYYDAIRRKLAFTRSLTDAGVSKDAAEHLFREFARHAKGFEKIVAETKEGDGAKLKDGYGRHMLDWHGLKAPTLEEIREKMAEALLAYNTVPAHVEPAKPEPAPATPIVVVPEAQADEDALDDEAYPPYALVPESYDDVPANPDAVYGGDIFAPLTDKELDELKKMRKSRDVDERAPYEMLKGNEDEFLGDSRVRMPMTKRDGAKKDPLAVDVLKNTMAARAARANEEMEMLDPTSRRYITTKKTEAWDAMTPEDRDAMIERQWMKFVTDGVYLVDAKNGNPPKEFNYLGIDDSGNVGFVDKEGAPYSFGVEQLEGEDPIVVTLQSVAAATPTGDATVAKNGEVQAVNGATPRLSPREHAEKTREAKRAAAVQAQLSDMQKRAGVKGFSNRQLEDMEEDGVFERMGTDHSTGDFEGTEEGRKNREKWQIASVSDAFQKSPILTFNDVKAVLGVGRNPTQHVLDLMTARGIITMLEEGKYEWTPKAEVAISATPTPAERVQVPTEAAPSATIESAPKVKSFTTAKGSVYTYLPDGKISRFKTATGEQMEAQDVIVFVGLTPEEEQRILYALDQPDPGEYVTLAEFGQTGPVRIVRSASDISNPEGLHLCIVRNDKIVLHKPVTQTPTVGLQTFDARAFEKDGKPWMSMHLGNKVTEITYEGSDATKEDSGAYIFESSGFKAGDAVTATIAGVDYPGVLRAFTKDGTHAFIEGSNTGIPIGSIRKNEQVNRGEKLSLEDVIKDYLSYQDLPISPGRKESMVKWGLTNESAKKYASALQGLFASYGIERVEDASATLLERCASRLKDLGVTMSEYGGSKSWAIWDIAKQYYFATHQGEADPAYKNQDPVTVVEKQQEIVDRHVGWEVYGFTRNPISRQAFEAKFATHPNKEQILSLLNKAPKDNGTLSSLDLALLGALVGGETPTEVQNAFAHAERSVSPVATEAVRAKEGTYELDEVGELWASFIEREYGLDINGKPVGETTTSGLPTGAVTPERIPLDIDLNELEKLGAELEEMATPEALPNDERIPVPIHHGVAKQFETKFGIGENSLGLLETFSSLSPAKQLLVLKNMEQATLSDVTAEAKKRQQEEWGGKPKWKRALQSIFTLGLVKDYQVRKIEQELLAKGKGIGATFAEGDRILAKKLSTIEELAKVAAAGPEVELEGDKLLIKYVSPEDLFASLGDKRLTSENLKALEGYNNAATAFAKLPHEWGYETTSLAKKESKEYKEKREAFETARAGLLSVFAERFGELGEANPEVAAMRKMNQLDEQVSLNQLFNQHPDAETALQSIEDTSAIKYAAKEFWKSKGKFAAAGALARGATIAIVGAVAAPVVPAALIAVGTYGAVTGIGAGVGFQIGRRQGNVLIKERRASGRMSEEDMREEVEFEKTKDGKPTGEKGKRKIREFTDAAFFIDRIDRLSARLAEETDPTAKALIEKKMTQTTSLMAAKLRHGMINFGGSSLNNADARKGASIANRLSFIQAMSRGVIETSVDKDKLDKESERLLGLRKTTIEGKRKVEIEKVASQAALIRGGFALGGAMIADIVHGFSAKGDFQFMKKIGTAQESDMLEPGVGEIPQESFPGALISQAEVDHSYAMFKLMGNRSLSLDESRALWHTEADTEFPDSAFYDTPRGKAHIKIMEAILMRDPVKSPSLTAAQINEIYKSVEFDAMTGKKLPHELPGYVQKPVVIPKHTPTPAADAVPTPAPKPAASAPETAASGPKLSEAERLEQVQRDAIKLQREAEADAIAKRVHKETLDQAAREEAEVQASAEYRAKMERYGASDGRYLHRPNEADWANQSRVAPQEVPRPAPTAPQAPRVMPAPVESAPRPNLVVPRAPQATPGATPPATPERLPDITPPAPSGDLDSRVEEALRVGRN